MVLVIAAFEICHKFKLTDLQWIYFGKTNKQTKQPTKTNNMDSTLTSPSYFHNCSRFSLLTSGIRLCSTDTKRKEKKIAEIKEQDPISALPESLGKEHHVFSHLCSSSADCSGSKFK